MQMRTQNKNMQYGDKVVLREKFVAPTDFI